MHLQISVCTCLGLAVFVGYEKPCLHFYSALILFFFPLLRQLYESVLTLWDAVDGNACPCSGKLFWKEAAVKFSRELVFRTAGLFERFLVETVR